MPDDDLAPVHVLHPVVEAELVDDDTWALRQTQAGQAELRRRGYVQDVRTVARVTRVAVTHDRTRAGAKAVARNVAYVPLGGRQVFLWWRENCTGAGYARAIREAEQRGDFDRAGELRREAEAAKQARFERVMAYIRSPKELVKAVAYLAGLVVGGLLVLGVAAAVIGQDPSLVAAPFRTVMWAIATVVWVFTVGGTLLLAGGSGLVLVWLWAAGRRAGALPDILAPAPAGEPATREVIPDESAILGALKDLGLPAYAKKLKEGWQPRWPLPTTLDGEGYRTQLELPRGVSVEMINKKKALLAHNLVRLPVEVWPTEPQKQPGVLDLWVAHQGLLTGPVKPHPLLSSGTCDYFKGVPVGTDQRGEVVYGRLMASNYAIGGIMGSGKTSLVLNLLLGAALDPLVDIDVFVMAHNVDYDPLRPRLDHLVKGDEDEHITAAMDGLRALREEVTERGKMLADLGGTETKVTRALAKREPGLRPKVAVWDECQELFRHEKYGEQAKGLAIKVITKARKCAISLLWVTPEPSADSLPRELPRVVSHGVCFAIGDYIGNDAILGTGSYSRGISAVDLDPHENIGTAMAFGFGPRPGLLRSFYVQKDESTDLVTPIVQRSLSAWENSRPVPAGEQRDLLLDVHEVMGEDDEVRAADLPRRLRQLTPDYRPYQQLTGEELVRQLGGEGVEVRKLKGYLTVRAHLVLQTIDRRDNGVEW